MSSSYLNAALGQKLDRALAIARRLNLDSLRPEMLAAVQELRALLDALPLTAAGENITALVRLPAVEKMMAALDTFMSAARRATPPEIA
jgi:hypothetical protein